MINVYLGLSFATSAVILLLLFLSPRLKDRYPAQIRCSLWLAVCVSLLLPIKFLVPASPAQLTLPVAQRSFALWNEAALPSSTHSIVEEVMGQNSIPTDNTAYQPESFVISLSELVTIGWLAGALLFLLYFAVGYILFLCTLKKLPKREAEEETLLCFYRAKAELNIKGSIGLSIYSGLPSPMLIGFFRPRILLPMNAEQLGGLELVLRHELIHYKRKDMYRKLLALIAGAIHWFNPLVHLMRHQMDIDCELACDEEVLAGEELTTRCYYCETVLSVMQSSTRRAAAFTTYFHSGKESVKMRLSSILDIKKKRSGLIALIAATSLLIAVSIFAYVNIKVITTKEYVFENLHFTFPDGVNHIVKNDSAVNFYIKGKLAGGIQFLPYNQSDIDGISYGEYTEESEYRQYSKTNISGINKISVTLRVWDSDKKTSSQTENHIYLQAAGNYKMLDIFEIEGVAPQGSVQFLADNFTFSKQLPRKDKGWIDVPIDEEEMKRLQQKADSGEAVVETDDNAVAVAFMNALYPKATDEAYKYLGVYSNSDGIIGEVSVKNYTYYYVDREDNFIEVNLIQPLTLGAKGVWAVSGYLKTGPLAIEPLTNISIEEAKKTSVIYSKNTTGEYEYANVEKLDDMMTAISTKKPMKFDILGFYNSKLVICKRLVYNGKKLICYHAYETFGGDLKFYVAREYKNIQKMESDIGASYSGIVSEKDIFPILITFYN